MSKSAFCDLTTVSINQKQSKKKSWPTDVPILISERPCRLPNSVAILPVSKLSSVYTMVLAKSRVRYKKAETAQMSYKAKWRPTKSQPCQVRQED
jgi:hypothetical protein